MLRSFRSQGASLLLACFYSHMSSLFPGAPRCFSTLRCRSTTSLSAPPLLPRYRPNAAAFLRNYRSTPLGRITPVSRESLREIPSSGPRLEDGSIDVHPRLKPSLLRPVLFAVAASTIAYTFAAADTNEDTEELAELASKNSSIFSRGIRSVDLALQRRNEVLEDAKATLKALLGPSPDTRKFTTRIATISAEWWINKSEAQRTCLGLIGVQAVIFALWRVSPRFLRKTFMHRQWYKACRCTTRLMYCPSDPLSGRSYSKLNINCRDTVRADARLKLCSRAHSVTRLRCISSSTPSLSILLGQVGSLPASLVKLYSQYLTGAMQYLWSPNREGSSGMLESTSRYHFLALFVTAGIISSLVSHCYTLLYVLPRALTSAAARSAIAPSHGASGSIYATIVITSLGEAEPYRQPRVGC